VINGAALSVEPVTATLPVAPLRVQSGVPPSPGAWVGQLLSAVAGGGEAGDTAWVKAGMVDDVTFDEAGLSELQAASVTTAEAAQTMSPTEEYVRKEFTVVTLQPTVSPMSWSRAQPEVCAAPMYCFPIPGFERMCDGYRAGEVMTT
jgi:hypothetical protein